MKTLSYEWVKANKVTFFNAGSLVGTTAVTSVLGLGYWWIAAQLFPATAVGFASAALSAMKLLGSICILGMGTLLTGELQRHPGKEIPLINAALLLVGGVGIGVGILFALFAPAISGAFLPLRASFQDILLFAAGVGLTAITLVLDHALIGLLRGELQFWRNTLFAFIKLIALLGAGLWLSHSVGLTIYNTWVVGNILSLVLLAVFVKLKGKYGNTYAPHWGLLRQLKGMAIKHHILNLIIQGPALALPLFVAALLSIEANAWFYIAWTITSLLSVGTRALATVLYAESSIQSEERLAHKTRLTMLIAFGICLLANIVLQVGAKQILGVFGQSYADQAALSLRILSLSAFPFIIKSYYIALCRIQNRLVQAMIPLTACAILELCSITIGAYFGGLTGISLGWLMAQIIEAICMSGTIYKAIQSPGPSSSEGSAGGKQCAS